MLEGLQPEEGLNGGGGGGPGPAAGGLSEGGL